ncbi:TetR/AcrR family transcriptional regulator [Clostridium sp. BSD2780061688st1 E8]|uniref:TetR/AcrR family transcriptional regulator n=1 Tax=unclassified Clostridium TaxID=2614128 RepID=UPI0011065ABF|nr:TetR/AcrR family transcriptional regulator [Clostridium sp. BSD2780061688st1 E8]
MKKAEKTELTREKIIAAALEEFGERGYEGATLNTICQNHDISKGLIYHNFKNKDDIYLHCVSAVLKIFMAYVKQHSTGGALAEYMGLRYRFFSENPGLSQVFFEAVLQPPRHLVQAIRERKAEFDAFNQEIYCRALEKLTLRQGVTQQEALEYYTIVQEMFNGYFASPAYEGASLSDKVQDHEAKLARILDFMLYGIARGES